MRQLQKVMNEVNFFYLLKNSNGAHKIKILISTSREIQAREVYNII